jgi:hypothetical protein
MADILSLLRSRFLKGTDDGDTDRLLATISTDMGFVAR